MSETSPTEQVDGGAGSTQVDLPADQNQTPSADEQREESVSGGDTQDADQGSQSQPDNSQTTGDDDSSSSDDDGLAKFAKSQGIDDLSDLSDRERALLKTAHDNQKAFRTTKQEQSESLKETVQDAHTVEDSETEELDPTDAREAKRDGEIAALRAEQRVNNFYIRNPEAREYDKEMTDIVLEEVQKNGKEAGRYLSADLERLLVLAKARRGVGTEQAKADGAREERERLRQRQEGSADSGHAQQSHSNSKKVTRQDISNMSDEEYKTFRDSGELQAAIDRGDLY